jgi:ABC-type bacteriocin/lantibiotic exporter with double-glycine peptidase domain
MGMFLLTPYLEKIFIDSIQFKHANKIPLIIGLMIGNYILGQVLFYFQDILKGNAEKQAWKNIVKRSNHNLTKFDNKQVQLEESDVSQELGQSYEMLKDFIVYYPVQLVTYIVRELAIVAILFTIAPPVALVVMIFVPVFIFISQKYGKKLSDCGEETVHSMKSNKAYLMDKFKLSFQERFMKKSLLSPLDNELERYEAAKSKQVKTEAIFDNFLSYAFLNLLLLLVTIVSGILVLQGKMTFGSLAAIELYASQFWTPVQFMVDCYKKYAATKPVIKSFVAFMNVPTAEYGHHLIETIQVNDYIGLDLHGERLHQPLSTQMRRGNLYVIEGENGVGKTTLILSMLGLSTRYDGQLSTVDSLTDDYTYVPGEPFASKFTSGNSDVAHLSYGQKKIAQLERAAQNDSSVYIFDEPTNFLDESHKGRVVHILSDLVKRNKIVIAITHDQSLMNTRHAHVVSLLKVSE